MHYVLQTGNDNKKKEKKKKERKKKHQKKIVREDSKEKPTYTYDSEIVFFSFTWIISAK